MQKTTIIFDMDGVLFDSERMYINEIISFFKQYDIYLTNDICKVVIGVDNKRFYKIVYQWWNNKTSFNEFVIILKQYFNSLKRDYSKLLNDNALELLRYLKENCYKIALASSSQKSVIINALKTSNIIEYFDLITSGDQFKESKPNPEIYLYTINKLHSSKEETIIVEDSYPGIQSAINAGIEVLALKDDYFGIEQANANYIIDNLIDIKDYL